MKFPKCFLPSLRCISDAGPLLLCETTEADDTGITGGTLRCETCFRVYSIQDGILRLMADTVTEENQHEIMLLDRAYGSMPETFEAPKSGWRSELNDQVEIPPHLDGLQLRPGHNVLEIGCGDGRYTVLMSQLGAHVLAFDFCIEALKQASRNLAANSAPTTFRVEPAFCRGEVGLVQADATTINLSAQTFDRCISATPLDNRNERLRLFRVIAEALRDDGRYVCGVEYDDLFRRLLGLPVMRRYSPGGVLIEHLTIADLKRESGAYFRGLKTRLIRVHLPLLHKFPVWLAAPLTKLAGSIPILRQFGQIVIVTATRPIRITPEGERRPGYLKAKNFYRWYKRLRRQEPFWDWGQPV